MTKILEIANLPHGLVSDIRRCDGDIDAVGELFDLDFPDQSYNRAELRGIVEGVTAELERDEVASAPTSVEVLDKKIDKELNAEITRLSEENKVLRDVAKIEQGREVVIHGETAPVTAELAKLRLSANIAMLITIKKSVSEHRKATIGEDKVNVQVNIGGIVSDAVNNIKKNQLQNEIIDIE